MASKEEQKPNPQPPKPEVKPRQANVDSFWASFYTKHPGTVYNVLPTKPLAEKEAPQATKTKGNGKRAVVSYEEAALDCKQAVEKISKECRRVNQKYRDQDFDIENDLKTGTRDCLDGLDTKSEDKAEPKSTKRIPDIFTKPQFYVDGASPSDVKQGDLGDCWLIAAIACLSNIKGLIEKVCVARDEVIGVYGFVFHRDGEWFHTLVDDKLYVLAPDWHEALTCQKATFEMIHNDRDGERKFRDALQKGSSALCFAKCREDNETWLPLLEKAYAKAHGDYSALESGYPGEGVEDMTGGVRTELVVSDILDDEIFWHNDVCQVKKDVLLSCYTGLYDNWQGSKNEWSSSTRSGIVSRHVYSILEAVEKNGQRLVKLRNPWNRSQIDKPDFRGDWSDGSKQWTPEWMHDLQYRFSDDKGAFWMSYDDMLEKFTRICRTRLFDDTWTITQRWTSINVTFTEEINQTEFMVTITKDSPVVVVLSRLDKRYFQGMQGEYDFGQDLFLHREGEDEYIARSFGLGNTSRSTNIDLPMLEPGKYSVRMQILVGRRGWEKPEDSEEVKAERIPERVLRLHYKKRPAKVLQQARAYDFAHAKGRVTDSDEEDEEAERPHDCGDIDIVSRHKVAENDIPVGVTPDSSKETTTDVALASSSPADPEAASAPNPSSSSEAGGPKSGDKDPDKDTPTPDHNKEPSNDKSPQGDIERQDAELAQNPWNAVCVVGLRVFSKDEKCSIKVIRPFRQEKYVPKPDGGDKKQDSK